MTPSGTVGENDLTMGGAGSSSAGHLVGNDDSDGHCATSTGSGTTGSRQIKFARAYDGTTIVVVTPVGDTLDQVTGWEVHASLTGATITFAVKSPALVTFNYVAEG